MYHANGHTVNRNQFNEKRTTMQDKVRKSRRTSGIAHGHMPKQDNNPNHIINPHTVNVDDDGLMTWG